MPDAIFHLSALVATLAITGVLSSCSELENAMEEGCDGLRSAAEAYAAGDREAFEAAFGDTMSLGVAVQYTDTESKEVQDEIRVAASGAEALHSAAFAPVENHDGEEVWRGREMSAWQRENLQAGLAVCENY